ncbi:unnamed protein product (macronuclear) [Paramecium tetraurelia]|uniref:Transmembrane protein n=1 Tax=Paramecium tetraurelia TaxID=5888 RepID=A0E8B5_PARTE|nr:uncharacterized protein GSPATT00024260001 [Paramecium tetraurelia]CAK91532.1 unnamed protein product [Paramecium tetraurelia]|eukprot:XP_001458929.1 hypothetical protein (macronuclear) [Paramecium tetraurelia strain d4-2]
MQTISQICQYLINTSFIHTRMIFFDKYIYYFYFFISTYSEITLILQLSIFLPIHIANNLNFVFKTYYSHQQIFVQLYQLNIETLWIKTYLQHPINYDILIFFVNFSQTLKNQTFIQHQNILLLLSKNSNNQQSIHSYCQLDIIGIMKIINLYINLYFKVTQFTNIIDYHMNLPIIVIDCLYITELH